jgi:DNA invertase Pin-like site-specific DNA recombinase
VAKDADPNEAGADQPTAKKQRGYSKMSQLPADEVVSRYQTGDSLAKLADAYGTSPNTIKRLLEQHHVERRPAHQKFSEVSPHQRRQGVVESLPASKVISEYRDGASLAALAASYGVSVNSIRRLMDAHGEERRSSEAHKDKPRVLDQEAEAEIVRRHLLGESIRTIATDVHLSKTTVWKVVQRLQDGQEGE